VKLAKQEADLALARKRLFDERQQLKARMSGQMFESSAAVSAAFGSIKPLDSTVGSLESIEVNLADDVSPDDYEPTSPRDALHTATAPSSEPIPASGNWSSIASQSKLLAALASDPRREEASPPSSGGDHHLRSSSALLLSKPEPRPMTSNSSAPRPQQTSVLVPLANSYQQQRPPPPASTAAESRPPPPPLFDERLASGLAMLSEASHALARGNLPSSGGLFPSANNSSLALPSFQPSQQDLLKVLSARLDAVTEDIEKRAQAFSSLHSELKAIKATLKDYAAAFSSPTPTLDPAGGVNVRRSTIPAA